jgi:SSS family solute:Na+ symporter
MASAEPIDLFVLALYAAAMVGFGIFSYTKVRGFAEYYDGGRRWGVLLIGFAVAATNMGAANTVGSVALAYREGVSAAWYVTLQAAAFIPFAFLAVPKFYALQETTLAEYLENRYQAWLRPVSAAALALATFAILPAQIVGGSSVIVALTGINYTLAFIGVGSCLVLYTSLGGLPSITYADTVQWLIVVTGFAVGVPLVVAHNGGLRAVMAGVPSSHASWWTGASGGWGFLTILAWSITVLIARFGSQEWYQRIRAARSPGVARRGLIFGGAMAMPFGLLTMLIGVAALNQFPALARPEEAFARAMMGSVPLGWRALMMGAILAAVVSSGESSVNAATALFVNDLCRPYVFSGRSDRFYLRLSQLSCAALGFAALALALVAPGIVEYVRLGFLIRTPVALTVLTGLFWRGATATGAAAGIISGTLAVLLWQSLATSRLDTFWIGTPVTLLGLYAGSRVDAFRGRSAAKLQMDI